LSLPEPAQDYRRLLQNDANGSPKHEIATCIAYAGSSFDKLRNV